MNDNTGRHAKPLIDLFDRRLIDSAYAYALDAIDDLERADLEARLRSARPETRRNFECAVHELQETMAVAAAFAALPPPSELRPRILDEFDRLQQNRNSRAAVDNVRRGRHWRRVGAAAAAAVVLGLGGVVAAQLTDTRPGSDIDLVLQARDNRTATLDVSTGGTAILTYSHEKDSAVVRFDGLAAPAGGTVYQMWLFKGRPQSAGIVDASDLTSSERPIIDGLGSATMFAITVEPVGGSVGPTTKPIASAVLVG